MKTLPTTFEPLPAFSLLDIESATMKQNRNSQCSCGSGKKAKKCCLLADMHAQAAKTKRQREAFEQQMVVARSRGAVPSLHVNMLAALASACCKSHADLSRKERPKWIAATCRIDCEITHIDIVLL